MKIGLKLYLILPAGKKEKKKDECRCKAGAYAVKLNLD